MFSYLQPLAFLAVFVILSSSMASASTLPQKKPPLFINFCEDAETPADKQDCTKQRFENAEAILNTQFKELELFLQETVHAERLTNAQNSWITYRNRECGFESSFFEEDVAKRTLELSCLSRMTENRALLLYNLIPKTRMQLHSEVSQNEMRHE